MPTSTRIELEGYDGNTLSARLEMPSAPLRAWAVLAHCFSCSKDLRVSRNLSAALGAAGYGVLRFDFTGLGDSEGDFADTNFGTNVEDLVRVSQWLYAQHGGDQLLIGHSLGGAASIVAAGHLPHVKAVATIGAPSDAEHVLKAFSPHLEHIEQTGEAEVSLAGRPFRIKQHFLDDVRAANVQGALAGLRRPILIMHSPVDETVGLDNATDLFVTAKHPKSFISLDGADHLLSRAKDAAHAGDMIAAWAAPYVNTPPTTLSHHLTTHDAYAEETGSGNYENHVQMGSFEAIADEPLALGGGNKGPDPYAYVSAGLAACTSITLRMYADRKGWNVGKISVGVDHARTHAEDCKHCESGEKVDVFERMISFTGPVDEAQRNRLLEIADKCPVHRTLEARALVRTKLIDAEPAEST